MVDHNKLRNQLMEGAIKAVSAYGLEGLTTRSIEQQCKLKDSYIYRYFEDKEDLLKKAFLREDRAFVNTIEANFAIMYDNSIDFKERCYSLWEPCWQYLVSRPDVCKFYVRYYYSTYFAQQAISEHTDICKMLVAKFADAFPKNVNVNVVTHHLLEIMLNYGMKVSLGELEDSKETSNMIFDIIYTIVSRYINHNSDNMSFMKLYSIVKNWNIEENKNGRF